jgi:23S rRNA pseudouridine1911/1915/1917 synthase
VRAGDPLEIDGPPDGGPRPPLADPAVEVRVVWADEHMAVVDKPAGLVVHPGAGRSSGTLVHGLLARFPELAAAGGPQDRPGIVHRLDKGTSGLLVVALNDGARRHLSTQLARHLVERRYSALVEGTVEADEGVVDAPLGRSETDPTRMAVRLAGRAARTRYRVEARYASPRASLLECRLETGRTHQIRVHLAAIGHPVVGDDRYGAPVRVSRSTPARVSRSGEAGRWADLAPGRLWLHARCLSVLHPVTSEKLEFSSPIPADLEDVLAAMQPLGN